MSEHALRFVIELLEDTHTGTGMGRLGLVDDTQSRDQQGRPVIWASTLRGLLREAGEDWLLARSLAGTAPQELKKDRRWLYRLFGAPLNKTVEGQPREQGVCQIRSLRVIDRDRQATDKTDSTGMFNQWTSTAREVHSRRPMEQTLRTVETAAAGLQLRGEIRWRCPDNEAQKVGDLVQRCLQRIAAVGSGKTRGLGRIRLMNVELTELAFAPDEKQLSEWLRPLNDQPQDQPVVLHLALRNLEPLNLVTTTYAGNLNYSLDYLPGTTLRGAFLHWIAARDSNLSEQLADPALFRVTNAYILDSKLLRHDKPLQPSIAESLAEWEVIPAPLSLRAFKAGVGPSTTPAAEQKAVPWWARAESASDFLGQHDERDAVAEADRPDGTGQRKRIKTTEYLARRKDEQAWRRLRPRMGVLLRNRVPTKRIDPDHRGQDSRDGYQEDALFSEQVIWDGHVFLCRLWFASREKAEEFARVAAPLFLGTPEDRSWVRVGRGGRPVRVEASQWQPAENAPAAADTAGAASPSTSNPDHVTVTLTSDLIGRTRWLTFATDPAPADWLRWIQEAAKLAGVTVDLPDVGEVEIDQDRTVVETVDVYGFNTATGLPRAVATALKQGSVITFRSAAGNAEPVEKLRAALSELARQHIPLGERIADGFGHFAVDLDIHRREYWEQKPWAAPAQPAAGGEPPCRWQEEVLQQVLDFQKQIKVDPRSKDAPSVTQWQWLRHRAEVATSVEDINDLMNALKEHADRLSGAQWKGHIEKIERKVNQLEELEQKKLFLTALSQSATAQARRERKKEKQAP